MATWQRPIFTPSACEGTSTLFEVDYFEQKAYLTQSGQLYGEAAAMAFGLPAMAQVLHIDTALVADNFPWPAAISPDGTTLVYSVADRNGVTALHARRIDQLDGHPIPGTSGASQPLFSPDGQWVAFEAAEKENAATKESAAPGTAPAAAAAPDSAAADSASGR